MAYELRNHIAGLERTADVLDSHSTHFPEGRLERIAAEIRIAATELRAIPPAVPVAELEALSVTNAYGGEAIDDWPEGAKKEFGRVFYADLATLIDKCKGA